MARRSSEGGTGMEKHGCGAVILSNACLNPADHEWSRNVRDLSGPHILLLQRGPDAHFYPNHWGGPGGLMESGETPRKTAVRETLEETGILFLPAELYITAEGDPTKSDGRNLSYFRGQWEAPENIIPQQGEVAGYRWFSLRDARNLPLSFGWKDVVEKLYWEHRK